LERGNANAISEQLLWENCRLKHRHRHHWNFTACFGFYFYLKTRRFNSREKLPGGAVAHFLVWQNHFENLNIVKYEKITAFFRRYNQNVKNASGAPKGEPTTGGTHTWSSMAGTRTLAVAGNLECTRVNSPRSGSNTMGPRPAHRRRGGGSGARGVETPPPPSPALDWDRFYP